MFARVLIYGVGLIGGSLAALIHEVYPECLIYGVDTDLNTCELANASAVFSACFSTISECDIAPDLVIACVPIHIMNATLCDIFTRFKTPMIVTDVASVKRGIAVDAALLSTGQVYIPAHPMAGIEKTGLMHANPEILKNANYVLVPSDSEAYLRLRDFIKSLRFTVIEMSAAAHDEAVALTSHFPYLWASILVGLAKDSTAEIRPLIASGFKDTSRVAGSSAEWGRDVLLSNADNILELIAKSREKLDLVEYLLKNKDADGVLAMLSESREFRKNDIQC